MELLIPALIIFLLAFTGLSIGIIFGRKGPSGSCSGGTTTNLIDMDCLCGQSTTCDSDACDRNISVTAVCTDIDAQKCREIQAEFEKMTKK
jgi:hypothetical protein